MLLRFCCCKVAASVAEMQRFCLVFEPLCCICAKNATFCLFSTTFCSTSQLQTPPLFTQAFPSSRSTGLPTQRIRTVENRFDQMLVDGVFLHMWLDLSAMGIRFKVRSFRDKCAPLFDLGFHLAFLPMFRRILGKG
jgi:hypothetical protein